MRPIKSVALYGAGGMPVAVSPDEKQIRSELLDLLHRVTFTKTDPYGKEIDFLYLETGSPNWKKFHELIGALL